MTSGVCFRSIFTCLLVGLLLNHSIACAAARRLLIAAKDGDTQTVQELLNQGIPVDTQSSDGITALFAAAKNAKRDVLKILLDQGANPELQDKNGKNAISYSTDPTCEWLLTHYYQFLRTIRSISTLENVRELEQSIGDHFSKNPNLSNLGYKKELLDRIQAKKRPLYLALLEEKENLILKDSRNRTPLTWVIEESEETLIPLFFSKVSDIKELLSFENMDDFHKINAQLQTYIDKNKHSYSPKNVHLFSTRMTEELKQYGQEYYLSFIETTPDINREDKRGWTQLRWAIEENNEQAVWLLLEKGAMLQDTRDEAANSLVKAVSSNNPGILRLIFDPKYSSQLGDEGLNRALVHSTERGDLGLVQSLLVEISKKEFRPGRIHAAKQIAKEKQLASISQLFEQFEVKNELDHINTLKDVHRFYLKLKNKSFSEAFNSSAEFNVLLSQKSTELYFQVTQDVDKLNEQDYQGFTPLYWAITESNLKHVQVLLSHGARVDLRTNDSETAIHLAAQQPNTEILKWVLQYHANPNELDSLRNTPLIYSATHGYFDHVKLLMQWDAIVGHKNLVELTAVDLANRNDHTQIAEFLTPLSVDDQISKLTTREEFKKFKTRALNRWAEKQFYEANPHLRDRMNLQGRKIYLRDHETEMVNLYRSKKLEKDPKALLSKQDIQEPHCGVCFSDLPASDPHSGPADCSCQICSDCLPHILTGGRGNGGSGSLMIKCPDCLMPMQSHYLKNGPNPLSESELLKFAQHQVEQLRSELMPTTWKPCGGVECPAGREVKEGEKNPYYSCNYCDWKGCALCQKDHPGNNCKFFASMEPKTLAWLRFVEKQGRLRPPEVYPENPRDPNGETQDETDPYYFGRYRPCPHKGCGLLTERPSGCNGMKCGKCKQPWNWNTGKVDATRHNFEKEERQYEPEEAPRF